MVIDNTYLTDFDIQIESLTSRDATIVKIALWLEDDFKSVGSEPIVATGTAIRNKEDKSDEEIGLLLAYGKAFEILGRKFLRRANGLVTRNENLAQKKEFDKVVLVSEDTNKADSLLPKRKTT